MRRFDLRHLKENFLERLIEIMQSNVSNGEVAIFIFEIGDFSGVNKSAEAINEHNWTLMNSLRFNQVDWTLVVKKQAPMIKNAESKVNQDSAS